MMATVDPGEEVIVFEPFFMKTTPAGRHSLGRAGRRLRAVARGRIGVSNRDEAARGFQRKDKKQSSILPIQ